MQEVVPNYYEKFQCIADKCKHNCCIGWEIEIDEDTLKGYQRMNMPLGERIRKTISQVVFDRLYWDRLDDGSITDEEVRAEIRRRLPKEHRELGCLVYDSWVKTLTPVPGMGELVSDLKKAGKKLYLLSNISEGFAWTYQEVPWLKELLGQFDGLVFSGAIAMVKPNREIFEYLLHTYDLQGEDCLFIDDRKENLDGAKGVGIKGYLFDGDAEKLRSFLNL